MSLTLPSLSNNVYDLGRPLTGWSGTTAKYSSVDIPNDRGRLRNRTDACDKNFFQRLDEYNDLMSRSERTAAHISNTRNLLRKSKNQWQGFPPTLLPHKAKTPRVKGASKRSISPQSVGFDRLAHAHFTQSLQVDLNWLEREHAVIVRDRARVEADIIDAELARWTEHDDDGRAYPDYAAKAQSAALEDMSARGLLFSTGAEGLPDISTMIDFESPL